MNFTRPKLGIVAAISVTFVIILFSMSLKKKTDDEDYFKLLEGYGLAATDYRPEEKLFDVDFKYVLNNEHVCENDSDVLALFIVTSYFGNVETRSAMRRAFSREDLKHLNFRRVFLLGRAPNDKYTTQAAIQDENNKFGDLIQGNFIEAYRNLTYKHVMGLKWAKDYCYKAKYVIKMDDDIVVNVDRISELLDSLKVPKSDYFLAGYVLRNMKPIREPANKWFVTEEEYQLSTYPQFVSGWFYVTSPKTCSKLHALSQSTKYFWIDDTYVTGILAKKYRILQLDISKHFAVHSEYLDCCVEDVRLRNLDCDILVGPNGGNDDLFYQFNNAMNICNLKLCKERTRPLNETCVAERKVNLGRGDAIVEPYKLH